MEEIKEVTVVQETALLKPEFKSEIKAEIKGLAQIEDNITEVQEYALRLNKYYENIIFTEDRLKEAKLEKSEVNRFKSKISDFRKEITKKYNEPLQKFIDTAKMTESILTDTYNTINEQVNIYEEEQLAIKVNEVKMYCEELLKKESIDFVDYSQTNINVTLSASMKSLKEKVKSFVERTVSDIKLINTQEYVDEMMIEYKKDLNVSRAITEVNNRHVELEKVEKQREEKREEKLNDEVMLNKIESLSAPKVKEKEVICETTFTVRHTEQKMKELKEFLDNGGYDYE